MAANNDYFGGRSGAYIVTGEIGYVSLILTIGYARNWELWARCLL